MSNSWSSWAGKSSVRMTIDFPWSPALKAMNLTSLNLLSMMPGRPSSAAKGGTAPGTTPSFLTSSSLHMRLFLANSSTLRNLLQLIFRSARYSNRQMDSFPLTSMVLEPHSSGVLRSSADSLEVLVAACSMIQNLMDLEVRKATILLYTCESYCWGSGSSCYFSIMQQNQHSNGQMASRVQPEEGAFGFGLVEGAVGGGPGAVLERGQFLEGGLMGVSELAVDGFGLLPHVAYLLFDQVNEKVRSQHTLCFSFFETKAFGLQRKERSTRGFAQLSVVKVGPFSGTCFFVCSGCSQTKWGAKQALTTRLRAIASHLFWKRSVRCLQMTWLLVGRIRKMQNYNVVMINRTNQKQQLASASIKYINSLLILLLAYPIQFIDNERPNRPSPASPRPQRPPKRPRPAEPQVRCPEHLFPKVILALLGANVAGE